MKNMLDNARHIPAVIYVIFIIEMCERCVFYGFNLLIIDYVLNASYDSGLIITIRALLYSLVIFGGLIGDRLGLYRSYLCSLVLLFCGYLLLTLVMQNNSLTFATFIVGVSILIVGSMLFKPNSNHYIAKCFNYNNTLNSVFTYFYAIINIGSLCGFLGTAYFIHIHDISLIAHVYIWLMLFTILLSAIFYRQLTNIDNSSFSMVRTCSTLLLAIISIICVYGVLTYLRINILAYLGLFIVITFFILSRLVNVRVWLLMVLLSGVTMSFCVLYMLLFSAIESIYPISWISFDYLNMMLVITITPLVISFLKFDNFSIPIAGFLNRFILAIIFIGVGFLFIMLANILELSGQLHIGCTIIACFCSAIGEMLVIALGAATVASMFPAKYGGFGQGIWLLILISGLQFGKVIPLHIVNFGVTKYMLVIGLCALALLRKPIVQLCYKVCKQYDS